MSKSTVFLHKKLSYAVRGVLFDVHNKLGPNLPEKFYNDAVIIGLRAANIRCQAEKQFNVEYRGVEVGRYYVDVWIEDGKMLLELKVAPKLLPIHRAQAISYLKVTDADVAFVVNFGQASLVDERLPNFVRNKEVDFKWRAETADPDWLYPELVNELLSVLHRVHVEMGAGFIHYVYRRAVIAELQERGIGHEYIKETPIYYKGEHLGNQPTRLVYVAKKVLVAAVAVAALDETMKAELKARMKHLGVQLGILANFNSTQLEFLVVR